MATPGQSFSGGSSGGVGGAGQVVVELCDTSGQGLVFWSRQRFEVCTEVQVRVRAAALPAMLRGMDGGWAMLRGMVVECVAERRGDGSCGFRVCLLVMGTGVVGPLGEALVRADERLFVSHGWLGGRRLGLN